MRKAKDIIVHGKNKCADVRSYCTTSFKQWICNKLIKRNTNVGTNIKIPTLKQTDNNKDEASSIKKQVSFSRKMLYSKGT